MTAKPHLKNFDRIYELVPDASQTGFPVSTVIYMQPPATAHPPTATRSSNKTTFVCGSLPDLICSKSEIFFVAAVSAAVKSAFPNVNVSTKNPVPRTV